MQNPQKIHTGINTESKITGYSANRGANSRYVKHLRIEDDEIVSQVYSCGEQLGSGNFGTVYEVRENKSAKIWAMKVVTKQALSSQLMKAFEREMQIMKMVQHPHIVHLHEIYETGKKIYLITEKCYTDLLKLFNDGRKFSEPETKRITADLAGAVAYLHKINIVHRDIKLDNVLVTSNPDDESDKLFIKLTDFGLSIVKTGRTHTDMLHDRCGTLIYMAPEVLLHQSYSQQCDVWSIGVILYALLAGRMPFDANEKNVLDHICHSTLNFDEVHGSPLARDLVDKVLEKNPAMRITAYEILSHPWLVGEAAMQRTTYSNNIIEMMRQCNDDLKVKRRQSALLDQSEPMGVLRNGGKRDANWNHRKSIPVSVQNIAFDKQVANGKRKSSKQAPTDKCQTKQKPVDAPKPLKPVKQR